MRFGILFVFLFCLFIINGLAVAYLISEDSNTNNDGKIVLVDTSQNSLQTPKIDYTITNVPEDTGLAQYSGGSGSSTNAESSASSSGGSSGASSSDSSSTLNSGNVNSGDNNDNSAQNNDNNNANTNPNSGNSGNTDNSGNSGDANINPGPRPDNYEEVSS